MRMGFGFDNPNHAAAFLCALLPFCWDRFGLSRRTTAAGQVTDYVRDDDGLVAEIVSSQGGRAERTIRREYDDLGRVTRVDYGSGEVETFSYDRWGRLAARARGGLVETYAYDHFGRLVERDEGGLVTSYAYDARGRLARQTVDGTPIDYAYTRHGRIAGKYLGGRLDPDAAVEYSPSGRVVARTANGVRQDYGYDRRGGWSR